MVDDLNLLKEPTRCVKNVANIITKFFDDTALSITLFESPVLKSELSDKAPIRIYDNVPTIEFHFLSFGVLCLNTNSFPTATNTWVLIMRGLN